MQRIQRYLLGQCLTVTFGLIILTVSILLLERLLRIADLLSQSPGKFSEAFGMLVNLVPHYLGIALPASLFLSILITVNRISQSGELVSTWSFGRSLLFISRPFILLGLVFSGLSLLVTGYLQPLSRYEYRQIVNSISNSSIETVFQESKFVTLDGWTVWTQQVDRDDGMLQDSFILEDRPNGSQRVIVSESGKLRRQGGRVVQIQLDAGMGASIGENFKLANKIEFDSLLWLVPTNTSNFRSRGRDERELTLRELWHSAQQDDTRHDDKISAKASVHDQLARILLMIVLPFLAIPLGLSYGRVPPSNTIVIGIVLLLTIQKSLEFGKSLAMGGSIPTWAGSWGVMAVIILITGILFARSAFTTAPPPLSSLPSLRLPNWLSRLNILATNGPET